MVGLGRFLGRDLFSTLGCGSAIKFASDGRGNMAVCGTQGGIERRVVMWVLMFEDSTMRAAKRV